MRIGFRTTIDQDLLAILKKRAIDKGVNANDIIEELIVKNLSMLDQAVMSDKPILEYSTEDKKQLIAFRVAEAVEDVLLRLGMKTNNDILQTVVYSISVAVAEFVTTDDKWWKKK